MRGVGGEKICLGARALSRPYISHVDNYVIENLYTFGQDSEIPGHAVRLSMT